MNKEEKNMIKIEQIQSKENTRYTRTLRGMLGMIDQIMRCDGHDEELFKREIADFMWMVTQANLNDTTEPRHENEVEHCGTFPKFKGEPGISHLIADAYPREGSWVDAFKERQSSQD